MNKNKMDALSFKLETIFAQNAAVIISWVMIIVKKR